MLLLLLFISTFRVFATLPLENLHQILSTVAIVLLSCYYLISLFINLHRRKLTRLDILMWIYILVNFLTAYKGNVVFGQPYYYGLLAQRSVLLSLSGMLLISLLINNYITIYQVERAFFFLSLVLLFVCYFFILFVNPANFSGNDFVAYSPIRGYRYRFQFALVIMLLFYSLFKISLEKKSLYTIIVFLILFYLVYFLQSRTTLVAMTITLFIYFIRNYTMKDKIKNILRYGTLLLIAGIVFFSLGYTSLFEKYNMLYNNVVEAFVSGSVEEASSAMRFRELQTALEYIAKNPLLGNGFISNQWNGGFHELLGYFYPVDIGILGNIFVFGIVGTAILYLPYGFSLSMSRKINTGNVFFKTIEYMLLFFFLTMFFSAVNIRDSSSIMFLVCMLYYFRYHFEKKDRDLSDEIPALP